MNRTLSARESLLRRLGDLALRAVPSRHLLPLIWRGSHSPAVRQQRRILIISRVQFIARVFAGLTLLWIPVDALTMAWPLWGVIALLRTAAALLFFALGTQRLAPDQTSSARFGVLALIGIPLAFQLLCILSFQHFGLALLSDAARNTYVYIPFIVAAGLGIFALTAEECAVLSVAILLTMAISIHFWPELIGGASLLATLWRLLVIAGIAGLAGMSQLHFLVSLIEHATRDALTGALTRKTGEELLESQFAVAARAGTPLTVAFLDLDHFKAVNDRFGHEAGDAVLAGAAHTLRTTLRQQDLVVRWGGEEFLVILPATDEAQARRAIARLAQAGLARRPDGSPQTASIGLAERIDDQAASWGDLARLADERMYAAKRAGRNACVGRDGKPISLAAIVVPEVQARAA